jgi:AbiV family abortive infection protein
MNDKNKCVYNKSLDYVEQGFRACWKNANDLVKAAKLLLDSQFHALALSISILAIEELAKLFALDGLLYARAGDHKDDAFRAAMKSHQTKLELFETFPLLLGQLSRMHPKHSIDKKFNLAIAISVQNLKNDGNAVMSYLKNEAFSLLDISKQKGFYVYNIDSNLVAPAESIDPAFGKVVYRLAWRATTTLDFLLKDGHLERYIENARRIRSRLSEQEHQKLERAGAETARLLFLTEDNTAENIN